VRPPKHDDAATIRWRVASLLADVRVNRERLFALIDRTARFLYQWLKSLLTP
jgi:hypothetical protein